MESLKRKEETWTLGVSRGGGRHGPLESWEGARGMDSWSLKGGGRRHGLLESLGRSAGRGLLESQEEARDMDSQSHEQERGTWTLGVSGMC